MSTSMHLQYLFEAIETGLVVKKYPLYHLKDNKGYATKSHLEALFKYGPTDIHRMSYEPVKKSKEKQLSIFDI